MNNFLRSFSFRAGLILFLGISATLLATRILSFHDTLASSYIDIQSILTAQLTEIDEKIKQAGPRRGLALVKDFVAENRDKRLFVGYFYQDKYTGHPVKWPVAETSGNWREIYAQRMNGHAPIHLYTQELHYKNGARLIIGYDLERVDLIRQALLKILAENVVLSLLLSFLLSLVLIWLLNRHLQKINLSFHKVMEGNLHYRLPIRHPTDQFDYLGVNLNRMLDWIQTLINTVKESSNALAHDIRTPLSRHRMELRSLMQNPKFPRELREPLAQAVERVDALTEMFDSILSIAKAEARSGTELFEPVDIKQLIADVVDFYAPLVETKNQSLTLDLPDNDSITAQGAARSEGDWGSIPGRTKCSKYILTGDKQLLGQAILNLVDNAIKYTAEGGNIRVSLDMSDKQTLFITVADNGPGIPIEMMEKVKERFMRLDESRHTPGTGLGLSLVEAVATLHQGQFLLEDNQPGLRAILRFSVKK